MTRGGANSHGEAALGEVGGEQVEVATDAQSHMNVQMQLLYFCDLYVFITLSAALSRNAAMQSANACGKLYLT
jgi:hypothetical protein